MRGDEERVIQAFCRYLNDLGWSTRREVGFVDVVAEKDGQRIFAEAKGRTAAIGLDVDTMFGQLLRRMPRERPDSDTRFAVVVLRLTPKSGQVVVWSGGLEGRLVGLSGQVVFVL